MVVKRKAYSSDLTDQQWAILEAMFPQENKRGRPRADMREVINSILYLERTGCQWCNLPHDLLAKSTVYGYFAKWRDDGTWQRLMDCLREAIRTSTPKPQSSCDSSASSCDPAQPPGQPQPPVVVESVESANAESAQASSVLAGICQSSPTPETASSMTATPNQPNLLPDARAENATAQAKATTQQDATPTPDDAAKVAQTQQCREATPSMMIIDSQSVKTTAIGGEKRGYDGGKKVAGRKRHIVVDTMGLLIAVVVTSASVDDGVAAIDVLKLLAPDAFPRLKVIEGDCKYRNHKLNDWLQGHSNQQWVIQVQKKPDGTAGFVVIRTRWVVERTIAWLNRFRRLCKDYEIRVVSSEAHCKIAAISGMLNKLAPKKTTKSTPKFKYHANKKVA